MKSPCTNCHWFRKILCIFACKEYNEYAHYTAPFYACKCGGIISFYPALKGWECNLCDVPVMPDFEENKND